MYQTTSLYNNFRSSFTVHVSSMSPLHKRGERRNHESRGTELTPQTCAEEIPGYVSRLQQSSRRVQGHGRESDRQWDSGVDKKSPGDRLEERMGVSESLDSS